MRGEGEGEGEGEGGRGEGRAEPPPLLLLQHQIRQAPFISIIALFSTRYIALWDTLTSH